MAYLVMLFEMLWFSHAFSSMYSRWGWRVTYGYKHKLYYFCKHSSVRLS